MKDKRRAVITLHHRDELSLGSNRARLGLSAYHWGILIQPKKHAEIGKSMAYDVSDGIDQDPTTGQDLNPNREWYFRSKPNVNPLRSGSLLGRVMIGKIPNDVTTAQIDAIVRAVPLPTKYATPEQNCVTWTLAAIQALQRNGLAENFDVNQFAVKCLELGDGLVSKPRPGLFYNYTNRPT